MLEEVGRFSVAHDLETHVLLIFVVFVLVLTYRHYRGRWSLHGRVILAGLTLFVAGALPDKIMYYVTKHIGFSKTYAYLALSGGMVLSIGVLTAVAGCMLLLYRKMTEDTDAA